MGEIQIEAHDRDIKVLSQCPFKINADVEIGGQLRVAHNGVGRLFDLQSKSVYDSSTD
jgi:hypothetical protein